MAMNDLIGNIMLGAVSIGALLLGLKTFNINLIEQFLPQYSTWIYRGIGAVGGYLLYTMFKR